MRHQLVARPPSTSPPVGGEYGLEEVAIPSIYPISARHPPPSEGLGEAVISLLYPTSARHPPPSEGPGEVPPPATHRDFYTHL